MAPLWTGHVTSLCEMKQWSAILARRQSIERDAEKLWELVIMEKETLIRSDTSTLRNMTWKLSDGWWIVAQAVLGAPTHLGHQ